MSLHYANVGQIAITQQVLVLDAYPCGTYFYAEFSSYINSETARILMKQSAIKQAQKY